MKQLFVRNADFPIETLHYTNSSFTTVFTKKMAGMIPMKFRIIRIKAYGRNEAPCSIRMKCFNMVMLISFCQSFNFVNKVDI